MSHFYTRRNIVLGLAVSLAIISFFCWYSYLNMRRASVESRNVNATLKSLKALEDVMDDMQDIETGQRGYIVSGDRELLTPYYHAVEGLKHDTEEIRALTEYYPQRQPVLEELIQMVNRKVKITSATLAISENNNFDSARREIQSGEGKLAMDSIRKLVLGIESEDRLVLNRSNASRETAATTTVKLFIGLAAIFIIGVIVLFWRISKGLDKREEYEKKIAYLAALTEKTSDTVISLNREGEIVTWNKGAEKLYGYTSEEVVGKFIAEITRSDFNKEKLALMYSEILQKGSLETEAVNYNKKGDKIYCLASVTPLKNEEGTITGYVSILRDISERKKAEQLLEKFNKDLNKQVDEKTAMIRDLLERVSDGFFSLDTDWKFTYINNTGAIGIGRSREELIGMSLWKVFPNAISHPIYKTYLQTFAEQKYTQTELFNEGLNKWFYLHIYPSPTGTSVFFRDITSKKAAEEELKRSNERFEMIALTTRDSIWEWNVETHELWANLMHQELYGLTLADPVPSFEDWKSRIHPDDREKMVTNQENALASGSNVWISEYRFRAEKKGYIDIYDRCYIVRNEKGKPVRLLGSMMDVTERKKAEEELVKTNARFQIISKATSDIVWDWNTETDELWWNDNYYSSMGYPKVKEIVNIEDWYAHIHPDDVARVRKQVNNTIKGEGTAWQESYRYSKADGTYLHFLDRGFIIRDASGKASRAIGSMVDMTPIYTAQRELTESENRLRTILNTDPECIKLMGSGCEVYELNPSGLKLMEADDFELIRGKSLLPVVADKYKEQVAKLVSEAFEGKNGRLEFEMVTLKGNFRWCEINVVPFRNAEGVITNALGVTRDVTDKRKAELELIRNEEKYRTLVEQAGDAIALYDADGRVLDVNTGAVNLLGYDKDTLKTMSLMSILTEEEIKVNPVQYDVLQQGTSTIKQRKMKRKDGSIVETEVRSQQLSDGRFLSVIRDLTERLKAQRQIEKEKELSDSIINSLPGVFYFFDYSGKFIRWNERFEKVSGYTAEEIAGMSPLDFFDPEDREDVGKKIGEVFENGLSDAEACFLTKSGEKIPYYYTGAYILNDGIPCMLGMGVDITDRKKAEEELNASYKAIRNLTGHLQEVREEERAHIAREIHDELGQQLTVLKMDVAWLNKKIIVNENDPVKTKMKDLLEMLDSTVKTVRRISSDLRPSLLDDLGLVAAMEWQLSEFGKRSDIKTNFSTVIEEIKLPGDIKTSLFRILQESLTNVARHSGATRVDVNFEKRDDNFVLSITDDGKGFDKQNIVTKKTLGILGMKERSAMIGGNYEIISTPGGGTAVIVTVPFRSLN